MPTDPADLFTRSGDLFRQARELRDQAMDLTAGLVALTVRAAFPTAARLHLEYDDESEGQFVPGDAVDADGLIVGLPDAVRELPVPGQDTGTDLGLLVRDLADHQAWTRWAPEVFVDDGDGYWRRELDVATLADQFGTASPLPTA